MKKFRFNPEFTLGHIIQVIIVAIPLIIFWVRSDERVRANTADIALHKQQIQNLTEAQNLLSKNQAILSALVEERERNNRTYRMP